MAVLSCVIVLILDHYIYIYTHVWLVTIIPKWSLHSQGLRCPGAKASNCPGPVKSKSTAASQEALENVRTFTNFQCFEGLSTYKKPWKAMENGHRNS